MNSSIPQVILGNSAGGEGSDPTRTGFAKYNAHVHRDAYTSFYQFPFAVGDSVRLYADEQELYNLLPDGTVILEIDSDQILLSNPAIGVANEDSIFRIDGQRYQGFVIESPWTSISLVPRSGFISSQTLKSCLQNVLHTSISNPAIGHVDNLLILPPFSGTVFSISGITDINTCVTQLLIDGNEVGSPMTFSDEAAIFSIPSNGVHSNKFSSNSIVSVRTVSFTGPLRVDLNIQYSSN
jgi:hypothetical protein